MGIRFSCVFAALLIPLLVAAGAARGQAFERRVEAFPVRDTAGVTYDFPFLGGLDTPRPQLADVDGDGDLDLFLQERRNRVIHFENVGTPAVPQFEWRTDQFQGLEVGAWFRFGDLDGDGDLDLLSEEPISNLRYYRNDGTPSTPDFVRVEGPLRGADGEPISAERQNVPALVAMDCEGPPDLMLGGLDGHLTFYRHTGTRDGGVPLFEKVADEYQNVCVGPPSVCSSGQSGGQTGTMARHGANAIASGDLGGDGDPDLLWGDFLSESLYFIENTGSCDAPSVERVADVYPAMNPLATPGYNVPYLADLDRDDDLDLLVGVLGGEGMGSSAVENVYYLENEGTAAEPAYERRTTRFVSTVDVGGASNPALVDLDGDGDRDLVIGSDEDPGESSARLHLFENTGSRTAPTFRQRSDPLLPDAQEGFNFVPAFGDVTGDAIPDLFVGTFSGTVRFYRNVGTAAEPRFARDRDGDVELPRGNFATPALVDIDADGDRDLFVGSAGSRGTIAFFRNEGTPSSAEFRLATETFADIRAEASRTHPAFGDADGDGTPDLFLGTNEGISVHQNTGTPQSPAFDRGPGSVALPFRSLAAPALDDVDGDGRTDLLVGGDGGGVKYFAGQEGPAVPPVSPSDGIRVAPNPFTTQTRLSFALEERASVQLSVYDVTGRAVSTLFNRPLSAREHTVTFDGRGRASGVYFYVLRIDGRARDRGRLILVR